MNSAMRGLRIRFTRSLRSTLFACSMVSVARNASRRVTNWRFPEASALILPCPRLMSTLSIQICLRARTPASRTDFFSDFAAV